MRPHLTTSLAIGLLVLACRVAPPQAPDPVTPAPEEPPATVTCERLPTLSEVAAEVVDSVVSITAWAEEGQPTSSGSGVVVASGIVLTNHHVVEGAAHIQVSDRLGTLFAASVVGSDERADLAVVRVEGQGPHLRPLPFGDSSGVALGEWVLAVGNPFGVGTTVTAGIVSATGRAGMGIVADEDFIQTDAAVNPGNSGGALVNTRGELIGINTAILSRSGGNQGIGFAVPSNMARSILEGILEDGQFRRGWLGAELQERAASRSRPGLLVIAIEPNSPAARGGLQVGDVILSLDGTDVVSSRRMRTLIVSKGAGTETQLELLRNGRPLTLTILLGESPPPKPGTPGPPPPSKPAPPSAQPSATPPPS